MNKKVVHSVFEQVAIEYPNNIAVQEMNAGISYSDLDAWSGRIAGTILGDGIEAGTPVGLYMDSSIEYIAAVLGVSKAGCLFAPLDVSYPVQRLAYIIQEIEPPLIITTERQLASLTAQFPHIKVLVLDKETLSITAEVTANPVILTGEEGCYLLYTSGSTGKPKAIEGCHKSLSHFIHWEMGEFQLGPSVRTAQLAPLLFDVSLRDIFVPLLSGGTVCIPPAGIREQPAKLLAWFGDMKINLLHMVPSVFRLITKMLTDDPALAANITQLQYILLAGEPLYGKDILKWKEINAAHVELVNLYGPSETTLAKLFNRITNDILDPGAIIPLGKPISNTVAIIIRNNKLCEPGEIGELYIKTPFRSRGYYKNEALTKQSFIQHPLHNDFEDIVYKTGDLARYDKTRSIVYIGRTDSQVKVRGNRVELSEVETAILEYPGIRQAVVMAVLNPDGENILACYYLEEEPIDHAALRTFLAGTLPAYMHPSFYIPMKEFPLSLNGKIDKKAFPRPEELLYEHLQYDAPVGELEEKIAGIWMEVLGVKRAGVTNSFFELGGHSLSAMRVIARIYKALGKELTLKEFFDHATIRKLATVLKQKRSATYKHILPVPEQAFYDVSHAQKRMWLLSQIDDELAVYNIPGSYVFRGALNRAAFEKAFAVLLSRHESLRTTFVMTEGVLKQRITAANLGYQYEDLRNEQNRNEMAALIAAEEAAAPFDLENGPLLRIRLLHMEDERFIFLFTLHHIISDGWSRNVFTHEIVQLYNAFSKGAENPLPLPGIQYKDYAAWQNLQLQDGQETSPHRDYWLQQFKTAVPVLNLPADYPRPQIKTYAGNTVGFSFGREQGKALLDFSIQQDVSPFMLLLAAVKVLLFRYSGISDIVVGTPVAGREHPDLEDQIGFYVNTLPLRSRFEKTSTFREVLTQVKTNTLLAQEHQLYPFDKLVDDLKLERDLSRSPLFDVMMVLQHAAASDSSMEKMEVENYGVRSVISKFDLTFHFSHSDEDVFLNMEYNTALFKEERIRRLFGHLSTLLESAVKAPDTSVWNLSWITAAETSALLAGNSSSAVPSGTLITQFEAQVLQTPLLIAAEDATTRLSYAELNAAANRLANYLRQERGVRVHDRVGLLMERSVDLLIGILGILKAGAAYVPVDPAYPAERILYTLEDAGVVTVLTNATCEDLSAFTPAHIADTATFDASDPAIKTDNNALAYIIYTSGSTGKPKGVMVEHRQVINLLFAEGFRFDFNAADVWVLFHSVCFDFSVWEIFGCLLYGGRLVIPDKSITRNAADFATLISEKGVTVLNQVPTMFSHVMESITKHHLRYIIFGGEALQPGMLKSWYDRYPEVRLVNMYGITETTVHVTYKDIGLKEITAGMSNIGTPLPNVSLYIMDEDHRLLPYGIEGELVIGGLGVARGYLNQEALTAARFITDAAGNRLYCSGDTGMMLPAGEVIYYGRKDDQVKIRGHRIELGEITQQLLLHEDIDQAVVVSHPDSSGQSQLVAYLVSTKEQTAGSLREYLSSRVPEYMLPSHYVQLAGLPVTENGKTDYKLLPAPEENTVNTGTEYVEPVSEMEHILAAAFSKLLGKKQISMLDNFFHVGGDSIKAIQIAAAVYKEGYQINVKDIFQYPVVRELALMMRKADRIADQSTVDGQVELTPIQQAFFAAAYSHPHHYNQAVMLYAEEGFDIPALEKAFIRLQEHHDILRTVFYKSPDGQIIQDNRPDVQPLSLRIADLQHEPNVFAVLQNMANEVQSGIDLENGPLMRLGLFRLQDGERLLIAIHHLIIDGVSWRILFEDLESLYQQFRKGEEGVLPLKTDSFMNWAARLKEYANSPAFLTEKKYWAGIQSTDILPLQKDYPVLENRMDEATTLSFSLDEALTTQLLTGVNMAYNTEINDILLAALSLAIKQAFGNEKVLIALEGHGRENILDKIDVGRTIGWFTSIYPVLLDASDEAQLSLHIKETKESLRKLPNKGIGFGILKYLTDDIHKQDISFDIEPRISFNYLGQFDADTKETSFQVAAGPKGDIQYAGHPRSYDLDISGMVSDSCLSIHITYNKHHFKPATIESLRNAYQTSLSGIIAHCSGMTHVDLTPSDLGYSGLSINDLETFFD